MFLQAFGDQGEKKVEHDTDSAKVDDLREMAHIFAAEIPEQKMSQAEIQGFLMNWKKKPTEAVANIKEWVKESRAVDGARA